MANFKISAPCRIVLSGEHSATYGGNLVVAGLNLRTKLEFLELHKTAGIISIYFPRVKLQRNIQLDFFNEYFIFRNLSSVRSNPFGLLDYVKYFITKHGFWETREQKFSLQIFFFLFYTIAYQKNLDIKPFKVEVSTEIPPGSGLGSSTSFAVCLAACFLHWKCLESGDHVRFNDQELEEIERYTEACEYSMQDHVYASIDATVCVRGKLRKYRQTDYKTFSSMTIDVSKIIWILVIAPYDIQKEEQKNERAQKMAELKFERPDFELFMNQLNIIANTIYDKLNYINSIDNVEDFIAHQNVNQLLQEAIRRNQNLLTKHLLLHPDINDISNIAASRGYGAKLTGFGGKFAYTVLTDVPKKITRKTGSSVSDIICHYARSHFMTKLTIIDSDGVKINN